MNKSKAKKSPSPVSMSGSKPTTSPSLNLLLKIQLDTKPQDSVVLQTHLNWILVQLKLLVLHHYPKTQQLQHHLQVFLTLANYHLHLLIFQLHLQQTNQLKYWI